MTTETSPPGRQKPEATACRGLLVVDREGLAYAALDERELRLVDVDEIEVIVGGLPPDEQARFVGRHVAAGDWLEPVTPSVLRLEPGAVLDWDEQAKAYVPIDRVELEVLSCLGWGASGGDLLERRSHLEATDIDRAVWRLVALGLVTVAHADPEPVAVEPEADDEHRASPDAAYPAPCDGVAGAGTGAAGADDGRSPDAADPADGGPSGEVDPCLVTGESDAGPVSLDSAPVAAGHRRRARVRGVLRRLPSRLRSGQGRGAPVDLVEVGPTQALADASGDVDADLDIEEAVDGQENCEEEASGVEAGAAGGGEGDRAFVEVAETSSVVDEDAQVTDQAVASVVATEKSADSFEVAEPAGPRWRDHRTPVFGVYHSPEHNANLGLGMIIAYARVADGGVLNNEFDLRRASIDPDPMLRELAQAGRPAVVLCSDFMWSIDHNLAVSREVKRLSPNSIVVHGGPHAPSYPGDAEQFLERNPEVDILVRGEGELAIAELLAALGPAADPGALHERISGVAGITYRAGGGAVVRTADRPRATDMDAFPSPYLTGEFADVDPARWRSATVESNRGCPYGCTFCDWGQVTRSRIRQFDLERVYAELEWIAVRGISEIFLADANFGIYARDVDIARHIAALKARYGAPQTVICSFAKNTVKHTSEIVRSWVEAGICAEGSVALQTTDPTTLSIVDRSNIGVEKYDALADEFRRHRLPIVTDLLMGLPGATVESFKVDLQRCLDQGVTPRIMETVVLPNSPMNDPEYRDRYEIQVDAANIVVATSSYTRDDFDEMQRIRLLFRAFEHFGLLRHLFRWLQQERGIRALDLIHEIDRAITNEAASYPLLTWVGRYFDLVTAPPWGWPPFYEEVARLLEDRLGVAADPALSTVLEVQRFLMPVRGRQFPDEIGLDHDYVAWLEHHEDGGDGRRLSTFPPGRLVVDDPAGVCEARIVRNGFSIRREEACDNPFWVLNDWELASELARPMATAVPLALRA